MIDKESEIFNAVASALRTRYGIKNIYVIGTNISDKPPKFPAVSFFQTNNSTNSRYSTFNEIENAIKENYKVEVFSNLSTGKKAQTKEIIEEVDNVMKSYGYIRTFNEPILNGDFTIARRVARYENRNVI